MKNFVFVSGNAGKVNELRLLLPQFEISSVNLDFPEIKSLHQQETVVRKALDAFALIKKPLVVEDTGLYLKAFQNFPGTYSKFAVQTIGIDGLLKLLEGKERGAHFLSMVAFISENNYPQIFEGWCDGKITEAIRPPVEEDLPYDVVFSPEGEERTFSQMTKEEKAKFSHRAKAFQKFAEWFGKQEGFE